MADCVDIERVALDVARVVHGTQERPTDEGGGLWWRAVMLPIARAAIESLEADGWVRLTEEGVFEAILGVLETGGTVDAMTDAEKAALIVERLRRLSTTEGDEEARSGADEEIVARLEYDGTEGE